MPHWPKPLGSRPNDFSLDRIKSFLTQPLSAESRKVGYSAGSAMRS
ncbi:hypothetical protein [Wolbachia endosymbiont of Muscidifurax uniraptor]|nr:folylpolyglutamate synthase [Wolbachia pipientis wUni]